MPKPAKLALATVLLFVVVFFVLWFNNVWPFQEKMAPPTDPTANYTPEQKQEFQKEQQQKAEWEKKQKPPSGA